ncbi:MAG: hypothetical protein RIE73_13160 [Coleofasciculus sp. C1-SOL-03]
MKQIASSEVAGKKAKQETGRGVWVDWLWGTVGNSSSSLVPKPT